MEVPFEGTLRYEYRLGDFPVTEARLQTLENRHLAPGQLLRSDRCTRAPIVSRMLDQRLLEPPRQRRSLGTAQALRIQTLEHGGEFITFIQEHAQVLSRGRDGQRLGQIGPGTGPIVIMLVRQAAKEQ